MTTPGSDRTAAATGRDPSEVLAGAVVTAGTEFNLRRRTDAAVRGLRALGRSAPLALVDWQSLVMAWQLCEVLEPRNPLVPARGPRA